MLNKDEIIRMAREVWGERAVLPFNDIERFAALVAAHEREACAKVCECDDETKDYYEYANDCAAAIQARTNKE